MKKSDTLSIGVIGCRIARRHIFVDNTTPPPCRFHYSDQTPNSISAYQFTDWPTIRFDDLLPEESEIVKAAIKRLPPKEAYDRVFRIRRAFQVRLTQTTNIPPT